MISQIIRDLAKFFVALLMPLVLIAAGAGVAALGLTNDWTFVTWTGVVIAGAGVVWGIAMLGIASSILD